MQVGQELYTGNLYSNFCDLCATSRVIELPMQARPSLLFIYRNLPKSIQNAIVRTLFPTYIVAAKVYVTNDEGKFLAVKTTYHPRWDIPSGHCDRAESPDNAAIRELFEETGLRLSELEQKAVVFAPLDATVQVLFQGKVTGTPTLQADNVEISEVRWVNRDEVDLNPYAREALDVILDHKTTYWVSNIKRP